MGARQTTEIVPANISDCKKGERMKKYFKYLYKLYREILADDSLSLSILHDEIVGHWYKFESERNIHDLLKYFGV